MEDIHTEQYDSAMNRENIVQLQAIGRRADVIVQSEGRTQGPKADVSIRLGIETWYGRTHFQKTNSLTGCKGEQRVTNGKVQGGDKFSGSQEHRNTTHKCPTWAHPGAQGNVTNTLL